MNNIYWELPCAACCTLVAMRLVVSPFWVYRNAQSQHRSELANLNKALHAKTDALRIFVDAKQKVDEIALIHTSLASFVRSGKEMQSLWSGRIDLYTFAQVDKVNIWQCQVQTYLDNNVGDLAMSEFQSVDVNLSRIPPDGSFVKRAEASKFSGQIKALETIVKNLDQFMPIYAGSRTRASKSRPFEAIRGTWPGDETIEELLAALRD